VIRKENVEISQINIEPMKDEKKNQKKDARDACVVKGQINFQSLFLITCVYMFILRNFFFQYYTATCPIVSHLSYLFTLWFFLISFHGRIQDRKYC